MSTDSPVREKKRKNAIQENDENHSPLIQEMQSKVEAKKRRRIGRGGAANDPIVLNGLGDDDEIDAVDYAGLHLTLVNMAIFLFVYPFRMIKFSMNLGIIARDRKCKQCRQKMNIDTAMEIVRDDSNCDGYYWSCKRSGCKGKMSIRNSSVFEKSKLKLWHIVCICYCWYYKQKHSQARRECQLGKNHVTMCDWYQFCRDVCVDIIFR